MTRDEYRQKLIHSGIARGNKKKSKQSATPSKYPQGYFKEKRCKHCGCLFTPHAPSELYCSDDCKDYGITEAYFLRTYGITIEDYLDMAEAQNYKCAICHKENFPMKECHAGVLVVDHNHRTGEVRGLLCHNCNRALGLLKDSTEYLVNSIAYLERVTTIPKGSTLK